jgi:hypothetical protein
MWQQVAEELVVECAMTRQQMLSAPVTKTLLADPNLAAYCAQAAGASTIEFSPGTLSCLQTLHSSSLAQRGIDDAREAVQSTFRDMQRLCAAVSERLRSPMISMMDFKTGDIALFMPAFATNRKVWMAFNSGYPFRFLSEDSVQAFMRKTKQPETRSSIIGRIICIERRVAEGNASSQAGAGMDSSGKKGEREEFDLQPGTEYFVCDAEPLYKSSMLSNASQPQGKSTVATLASSTCTPE